MSDRFAVVVGFGELPANADRRQRFAHQLARTSARIIRLGHDSGDPEVIYHCPSCGSGQVTARSDGTVECGFCKMCFTVQVQPRYPAFPQTIDGVPMEVPGMGPQWPGQDDTATRAEEAQQGMPVDGAEVDAEEDSEGGFPPGEEDEQEAEDDDVPPFLKKSYRSASGVPLNADQLMRHAAMLTARRPDLMAARLREMKGRR